MNYLSQLDGSKTLQNTELEVAILLLLCLKKIFQDILQNQSWIDLKNFDLRNLDKEFESFNNVVPQYLKMQVKECMNIIQHIIYSTIF